MTEDNLSQKLFKQKDGKLFAYADEIKKSIKKLKEKILDLSILERNKDLSVTELVEIAQDEIDAIFGRELI